MLLLFYSLTLGHSHYIYLNKFQLSHSFNWVIAIPWFLDSPRSEIFWEIAFPTVLEYENNFCFAPPSILQWVCPQEEVERSLSLYSQCNPSLIKVHKVSLLCLTKESSIKLRIKTCQPGKAAWKERVSLMLPTLFRLNKSIAVPETLICTRWTCWFLIYIDGAPAA